MAFGSAAVLVVAGAACDVLVGGLTGQVLLIALIFTGLGGALLLLFLEVGLSEDRERERDERHRDSLGSGSPTVTPASPPAATPRPTRGTKATDAVKGSARLAPTSS